MRTRRSRLAVPAIALLASLGIAACSSDDAADTTPATEAVVDTTAAPVETVPATEAAADTTAMAAADTTAAMDSAAMDSAAMDSAAAPAAMASFGPACSAVPADGAGSFAGMAEAPAATAASANPVLSTLVAAVTAAGLVDTLNGPGPFTIIAPSNDAFAKIDKATLDTLLADPKGDLTKILTYHVIPGKALSAADLLSAGKAATVQGGEVTVTGSGQDVTINGTSKVVCGDVKVANGIVHIVDTVLMPS